MIKWNRQRVVLSTCSQTENGQDPVVTLVEPLVHMTNPHVSLNCLINCPLPKINYYNPAPELSFSKKKLIN